MVRNLYLDSLSLVQIIFEKLKSPTLLTISQLKLLLQVFDMIVEFVQIRRGETMIISHTPQATLTHTCSTQQIVSVICTDLKFLLTIIGTPPNFFKNLNYFCNFDKQ